jgi:hypothetical protein
MICPICTQEDWSCSHTLGKYVVVYCEGEHNVAFVFLQGAEPSQVLTFKEFVLLDEEKIDRLMLLK